MVLEAVYEEDFLKGSYGFRPNLSAHHAIKDLWKGLMNMDGGYVVEVDIKSYFDTVDNKKLRSFLDKRVRDGVIRKTIDKWLKAGVMEGGQVSYPEKGTPQGAVISPLLANIYLHEVLDEWFETVVKNHKSIRGTSFAIRFADDFVLVFEYKEDAEKVLEVLPKRFEKYGLELHPKKTGLVPFEKPEQWTTRKEGTLGPETFTFVGFNLLWGKSRKKKWVVKTSTARDRLSRALNDVYEWCKENRHNKVGWQYEQLMSKLRGHFNYYGITGNSRSLYRFAKQVKRIWFKWLNRRSQKRSMNWKQFTQMLVKYPIRVPKMGSLPFHRLAKL